MDARPNIAFAASLIADGARSAMLVALLDGRARPAGDLAVAAGVTAQTASSHLAKLLDGGLVTVAAEGRHRYYRLAGSHVALALEGLAGVGPRAPVRRRAPTREARKLALARCCYDHLAGRLGVAVARGLEERGFLVPADDRRYDVTPSGAAWFGSFGLDAAELGANRRGAARRCLDWTERQDHLAGPLGTRLMGLLCSKGWIRRAPRSREVQVTPAGWNGFRREFGLDERELRASDPASAGEPVSRPDVPC